MSHAIAFKQKDGVVAVTCSTSQGVPPGGDLHVGTRDLGLLLTVVLVAIRLHGSPEEQDAAAKTCRVMLGRL